MRRTIARDGIGREEGLDQHPEGCLRHLSDDSNHEAGMQGRASTMQGDDLHAHLGLVLHLGLYRGAA